MALAGAASFLLKPQTALQQLLEEINFQRTKEMRQLLKDDSGFVVLQGTTYWTDLFVRHFLFQSEPVHSIDSDDLLFFVRKKHVKGSSRHMPKFETEVDVYRKDSRKLPIGDPDVDWEETVYLNMVIHQFDYTLTLAICTRTSPKELQVLRRHSQRVYASPSRRKMDTKGDGEEMTYPHICFMVDNFDEVFSDILVRDGEMVCVELVANDKDGSCQGVIFLGSIRYDALKKVYDARQSSLSSKVAQRMTFGLFSSGAGVQTRCEFVRMKGPQGKGHAEMAVTKPKGSGVETPTSEPGFCATEMWDEWEEDPDDYYYRNQRRLSDPSANLNNFSRYGWRTKQHDGSAGCKARSENEGLDSLANEVSEIEAGNLRDDLRPASSAPEMKLNTTNLLNKKHKDVTAIISPPIDPCCTNCFSPNLCKKRWTDTDSAQMSDIYCRSPSKTINNHNDTEHNYDTIKEFAKISIINATTITAATISATTTTDSSADDENASINLCETPACLEKFPNRRSKPKHKNILNVESELILTNNKNLKTKSIKSTTTLSMKPKKTIKLIDKEELTKTTDTKSSNVAASTVSSNNKKEIKKISSPKKDIKDKDKSNRFSSFRCKKKTNISESSGTTTTTTKTGSSAVVTAINKSTNLNKNNSKCKLSKKNSNKSLDKNKLNENEYEIADDVTSLNEQQIEENNDEKICHLSETETKTMICVNGKEELPSVVEQNFNNSNLIENKLNQTINENDYQHLEPTTIILHPLIETIINKTNMNDNILLNNVNNSDDNKDDNDDEKNEKLYPTERCSLLDDYNGNHKKLNGLNGINRKNHEFNRSYSLPRMKKSIILQQQQQQQQQLAIDKAIKLVPKRKTPDGTNIYYWCDLPKKSEKELDDGAYNPLWATKGFTQSFHFWKENRRQQSTPLNAFLTYVTLPWWSIAKDLLDHRETPILTF